MIVPAYFEDLLIQSENALPNRAYFIPASTVWTTLRSIGNAPIASSC